MESFTGLTLVILGIFILIVCILWVMLPFLIMGTNRRLDDLIELMGENIRLQREK